MSDAMPVRVMVTDVWDEFDFALPSGTPVGELKRQALHRGHVTRDPAGYLVKYRGAVLADEGQSLSDHGVVSNAALIVLPRRRRPVR
ncbi:MAG: hypothetical protein AB7I33_06650 [Gemmatimonadales bacterium]